VTVRRILIGLAALVAAVAAWKLVSLDDEARRGAEPVKPREGAAATGVDPRSPDTSKAPQRATAADPVATAPYQETFKGLAVVVRWDDGTPCAGARVAAKAIDETFTIVDVVATTDAEGRAASIRDPSRERR
jgi:hypothetical protein